MFPRLTLVPKDTEITSSSTAGSRAVHCPLGYLMGLWKERKTAGKGIVQPLVTHCRNGLRKTLKRRKWGSGETLLLSTITERRLSELRVGFLSQERIAQGERALSYDRAGPGWILWKISSLKGWLIIGMDCPGKWWGYHSSSAQKCVDTALGLVDVVVFSQKLDPMILKVFSNLKDSRKTELLQSLQLPGRLWLCVWLSVLQAQGIGCLFICIIY